ncbi:hypothetical protein Ddye_026190 [Dipteronia dyeriana]|uniref:Ubiquitin-like protease family profile domain-containing protein n=1 Tax=Dipteronia dyeriana TaxID=168575 RepID=A0AAD9TMS6_9ROSI|nr:hypothetical protein Ddye_026190 [Dipteronia dyeriana]
MSPFIDPTRASVKKLQQDMSKYDQFKRKAKLARRNVRIDESVDKSFFMELEDPTKWLSTDTKLNLAWKKILETDNEDESSFDALAFECLQEWIDYGFGNRPGWGQHWWLYTQLYVPCCVGEPDGHWILCKVDLLDHHITIFDPIGAKTKSIQVEHFRQLMLLRRLLSSIMNKYGFFSNRSEKPRGVVFTVLVSSNQMIPQQVDKCSCGVFICKYAETSIFKKGNWKWGQKEMNDFRKEMASQIYNNSVPYKSPIDL